jgi:UDP-N-acetylmuramate dehydrogenase
MYEYIKEFLKTNEVKFLENKSLRALTTVKIGGTAAILTYPKDEAQFMSFVSFLRSIGAKFTVLGRMSNVLPPDDGYDGVIIKTDRMSNFTVKNNTLTASAGVGLPNLSRRAISLGIAGFEELSGIPGSVGGAVAGNAGAFGRECSELLVEALIYDFNSGES